METVSTPVRPHVNTHLLQITIYTTPPSPTIHPAVDGFFNWELLAQVTIQSDTAFSTPLVSRIPLITFPGFA